MLVKTGVFLLVSKNILLLVLGTNDMDARSLLFYLPLVYSCLYVLTYKMLLLMLLACLKGQHFCLKCAATSTVANIEPKKHQPREVPEKRTLATLQRDLKSFREAGSDISKAKLHNNVIAEPIFGLPLDQVGGVNA